VGKAASTEQVKTAFYTLAKKYHPDANQGFEAKFKEINEAYRVLSDNDLRKRYDNEKFPQGGEKDERRRW
jgi:DnaJ-class molecular chaperone